MDASGRYRGRGFRRCRLNWSAQAEMVIGTRSTSQLETRSRFLRGLLGRYPSSVTDGDGLLRTQRNNLFQVLEQAGEDPRDFEWVRGLVGRVHADVLAHSESGHYFAIAPDGAYFHMEWTPDAEQLKGQGATPYWANVGPEVSRWLRYMRRELEAPDFWTSVLAQSDLLQDATDPRENGPLSELERDEVRRRVEAAKRLLLDAGLDGAAMADADRKLDYLVEAADRMGRFD